MHSTENTAPNKTQGLVFVVLAVSRLAFCWVVCPAVMGEVLLLCATSPDLCLMRIQWFLLVVSDVSSATQKSTSTCTIEAHSLVFVGG